MSNTCENCKFWNHGGQGYFGNRYAKLGGKSYQIWAKPCQRFPEYQPRWFDDWCGEFEQKMLTE